MPSGYKLQDWEKQAIMDAYKAGEPTEALSAEFNTTPSNIRHLAARRGIPPRPRGLKREQAAL